MPRRQHPEPFWRQQTQCYYVQIGKKQHRLSSDREDAFRVYHELMSRPPDAPRPPVPPNARRAVEIIDQAPLARVRKPSREGREMAITPALYRRIIKAVKEPNFRDLIELAWETGACVQELRKIEARFVDSRRPRIVFPRRESKGKRHHLRYLARSSSPTNVKKPVAKPLSPVNRCVRCRVHD